MGEPLLSVFTHLYLHPTGESRSAKTNWQGDWQEILGNTKSRFLPEGLAATLLATRELIDPPSKGEGSTHASVNDPAGLDKSS